MHAICPVPGCPMVTNGGRCDAHKTRSRERRPSRYERGYDGKWIRTRKRFLAGQRWCVMCLSQGRRTPATEAHHLDGRGPLGPQGHDFSNLMALCKPCHSRLTNTHA